MQTIETLLQQGIATSVPQMLDLNQDGLIDSQDLQLAFQSGLVPPINCEPLDALLQPIINQPLAALVQTILTQPIDPLVQTGLTQPIDTLVQTTLTQPIDPLIQSVVDQVIDLNGKAPYILSDAQLAELGVSLQASGVPVDITAAVLNDMQTLSEATLSGVSVPPELLVTADALLTEASLPQATEPVPFTIQPWMAKEAALVEMIGAGFAEPVFYNDGMLNFDAPVLANLVAPSGVAPLVDQPQHAAPIVAPATDAAAFAVEPVFYNDGQTGDTSALLPHPVAPEASQATVIDHSTSATQAGPVVDAWLDAHQGNPWINLTGAATGADAAGADSIMLTLKDLLAMPSDAGGVHSAKITGDAADTVNLANIFGNGADTPLGQWDVQGSVMQDGQSFTAYSFSGNAQLQVLVDDHIQHVNLG